MRDKRGVRLIKVPEDAVRGDYAHHPAYCYGCGLSVLQGQPSVRWRVGRSRYRVVHELCASLQGDA